MAILSKENYLKRLQERVGDDTSDSAMSFIEDMTDTFNDMETKSNNADTENWKQKYNDLDKSWREKYKARFFNSDVTPESAMQNQTEDVIDDGSEKTFDDLFIEREG